MRTPAHCSCRHPRPSSRGSNLRTRTLSYRLTCPLFSACRNMHSRRCKTCREAHTAAPSVPSCSSSPVLQTSCCMHSRCCIFLTNDTDRSGCTDTGTPRSLYHRSFHEVHSADAFRSWNRYRHSMRSGRGTDAGLQRYRCPQPHWLPAHVYSAWTGSTVPMGRRRIRCTRSCCRYGKLSGLPPSRWQPHTLRSDKLP